MRIPWVSYTLLGLTTLVFLLQLATQSMLGYDLPAAVGAKVNELIVAGQYWRLLTPVFLHANFMHFGFNMYALFVLGPGLERLYGHERFIYLYFLGALAGITFPSCSVRTHPLGPQRQFLPCWQARWSIFTRTVKSTGIRGQCSPMSWSSSG